MNIIAQRIISRLSAHLAVEAEKYARGQQLGFGFVAKGSQRSIEWKEELHPRASDGKFATEEGRGEKGKDEPDVVAPKSEDDGSDLASQAEAAFAEDVKDESPREEATKEVEHDAKSEQVYAFARESAIPNMGEDVLGSARHKRNQWKGLEEAEKDGTADELVTREKLLKNEPHGLAMFADTNPMTAIAMHYAMRSMPEKPGYKNGDVGPKEREQYLELYRMMKTKAEKLAEEEIDPRKAVDSLWKDLSVKIRELRGHPNPTAERSSYGDNAAMTDRYNQTANIIASMASAFQTFRSRPKANSIMGKTAAFVDQAAKAVPELTDKSTDASERAAAFRIVGTAAISVMSGKSVPQAFGTTGTRTKSGFSEQAQYVATAERRGGKDVSQYTTSGEKAAKHLGETYGLRGVQWGNSLTDEERKHHAIKTVEAFTDLADVLGIKPEDVSLGRNIALGVASRGKAGSSATYWSGKKFINLNRSSGVGSLAHEWGHAFDHSLTGFEHMGSTSLPHGPGSSGAVYHPAIRELQRSMESSGFKKRLIGELQTHVNKGSISASKANKYWLSDHEMFARSFERYVQRKLHKNGAENTYLVGLRKSGGGLWPTDDEVDQMSPHFEKLLATYRKEKYGSEEPQKFSRATLMESIRLALTGSVEKYRETKEDGHWVTINGNHVFIEDSTAGEHAKASGAFHRVRSQHIQNLMPEAHKFLKGQIDQREIAKAHARKLSRLNSGSIAKIENNYRDWSSVDGFDSIARDVAIAHPELGFDPDDTDTPGKVWDLIREGKEEYPAADSREVSDLAATWLKSSSPKSREVYPEDALQFSRAGSAYKPEMIASQIAERVSYSLRANVSKYAFREEQHPRDDDGRFTSTDSADSGKVRQEGNKLILSDGTEVEIPPEQDEPEETPEQTQSREAMEELHSNLEYAESDNEHAEAEAIRHESRAEKLKARYAKLEERASALKQRLDKFTAAENDARNEMDAALDRWDAAYNAHQKVAESDDTTDEQLEEAEQAMNTAEADHDNAEAAWDAAYHRELEASEKYDQAQELAWEAEEAWESADKEAKEYRAEANKALAEVERIRGLVSGEIVKYSAENEERWITIGGSESGGKRHSGGTHVKIDDRGKIVAGPSALVRTLDRIWPWSN